MNYFLVIYDRASGSLLELMEYGEGERSRALEDRFVAEREYRSNPSIEVVVLGAASKKALTQTHSRYFKTPEEILREGKIAHG